MSKIRKTLAAFAFATSLTAGVLGATATEAAAAVTSPSGAQANTTLVCQRMTGAYTLHTGANNSFHWARQYLFNTRTGTGTWGGWVAPSALNRYFSLPSMGTVQVYVQYAYWNGGSWEFSGEWGRVYNRLGQFVSYSC